MCKINGNGVHRQLLARVGSNRRILREMKSGKRSIENSSVQHYVVFREIYGIASGRRSVVTLCVFTILAVVGNIITSMSSNHWRAPRENSWLQSIFEVIGIFLGLSLRRSSIQTIVIGPITT